MENKIMNWCDYAIGLGGLAAAMEYIWHWLGANNAAISSVAVIIALIIRIIQAKGKNNE